MASRHVLNIALRSVRVPLRCALLLSIILRRAAVTMEVVMNFCYFLIDFTPPCDRVLFAVSRLVQ